MAIRDVRTAQSGDGVKENDTAGVHGKAGHGDVCRCQETSKMSPRELIKIMMSDLAFWKKSKKE
jgi:hypothetical protein